MSIFPAKRIFFHTNSFKVSAPIMHKRIPYSSVFLSFRFIMTSRTTFDDSKSRMPYDLRHFKGSKQKLYQQRSTRKTLQKTQNHRLSEILRALHRWFCVEKLSNNAVIFLLPSDKELQIPYTRSRRYPPARS